MADDTIIRVDGLWKRYGLPLGPAVRRLGRRLRSGPFGAPVAGGPEDDGPWALRDVSLEIRRGETLGVIGRNGAGKSTLLKVLAGVTPPTKGRVEVLGSVFPMIELNAGMHPELTGRENVRLLGAVMGLSRREVQRLAPEIEEFCELGEWFDQPVRKYSTGMLARLGFSVAVNVESEVLLIDEVLAAGDITFQNKCLRRVKHLRHKGRTAVLVSHNLEHIHYLTDRCAVLEGGACVALDSPQRAINRYEEIAFGREDRAAVETRFRNRRTSGDVDFRRVRVLNEAGEVAEQLNSGEEFAIEAEFLMRRELSDPNFTISIVNASGIQCIWHLSREDGLVLDRLPRNCRLRAVVKNARLANGAYQVNFALRDARSFETVERFYNLASFVVKGQPRARGILNTNCEWSVESME